MDLSMYHNLPKKLLSIAKTFMLKMKGLKLFVQGLQLVERFKNFVEIFNLHKQSA